MAGANYMGGKRNAAKARFKDATGRIQKGFFGRRRLDILSKGLANKGGESSTQTYTIFEGESRPIAIDLAHAKKTTENPPPSQSYIPSPTCFPLSTPRSKRSNAASNQELGSDISHSSSKVLDVLDTSEPMFLRATLNRILALPDLAGLSGRRRPIGVTKRSAMQDKNGSPRAKRQKTYCRDNKNLRSSQNRGITLDDARLLSWTSSDQSQDESQLEHVDIRSPSLALGHDSANLASGIASPATGSRRLAQNSFKRVKEALPAPQKTKDPRSYPRISRNRPAHPVQPFSSLPPSSEPGSSDHLLDSQQASPLIPGISFSPHPQMSISKIPPFSSNNLYEHEDPWHTIGIILGLSPASSNSPRHSQGVKFIKILPQEHSPATLLDGDYSSASFQGSGPRTPDNRTRPQEKLGSKSPHYSSSGLYHELLVDNMRPSMSFSKSSSPSNRASYAHSTTSSPSTFVHHRTPSPAIDPDTFTEYGDVNSPFRLLVEKQTSSTRKHVDVVSRYPFNLTDYGDSDPTRYSLSPGYSKVSPLKILSSAPSKPMASFVSPAFLIDSNSSDDDDGTSTGVTSPSTSPKSGAHTNIDQESRNDPLFSYSRDYPEVISGSTTASASTGYRTPSPHPLNPDNISDLTKINSPFRHLIAARQLTQRVDVSAGSRFDLQAYDMNVTLRTGSSLTPANASFPTASYLGSTINVDSDANDEDEDMAGIKILPSASFPLSGDAIYTDDGFRTYHEDNDILDFSTGVRNAPGMKTLISSSTTTRRAILAEKSHEISIGLEPLEEVDGLFRGPCLFPNDCESDAE